MKLLLSFIIVIALSSIVWAQEKPKVPAGPQPDASQQKLLKEALAATDKATNELALAQAKADAARAKFFALLANVQAELQLRPSEWTVRLSPDGDIGFERIVAAKADSKPTGAPKP